MNQITSEKDVVHVLHGLAFQMRCCYLQEEFVVCSVLINTFTLRCWWIIWIFDHEPGDSIRYAGISSRGELLHINFHLLLQAVYCLNLGILHWMDPFVVAAVCTERTGETWLDLVHTDRVYVVIDHTSLTFKAHPQSMVWKAFYWCYCCCTDVDTIN